MTELKKNNNFIILLSIFHIAFIILFAIFTKFPKKNGQENATENYLYFTDINAMIFIGFGFLMTFLRRYGFSAVGVNMLLACTTIEWSIIIRGLLSEHFVEHGYFTLDINSIIYGDISAAVILISMGAVLGKLSPVQYLIMAIFEVPAALVTEHVIVEILHVSDCGGSIVVHVFGAYFGLAIAKVLNRDGIQKSNHEGSIYHSDIFAMIGTLVLWIFWGSFNAALASGEEAKRRCLINTMLSLSAATIATFITSQFVNKHRKFDMVHMANSTLAGGVAIGTVANLVLDPFISLIIGTIAGCISVLGYEYITPALSKKAGIHDTCGVGNLHGIPGIIAGISSIVLAFVYTSEDYDIELFDIYPALKNGRTMSSQALYQLLGLGLSFFSSIITGAITAVILRLKIFDQVPDEDLFSDERYYHTPSDFDFTTRIIGHIDNVEITEKTI
uniref:Ammonium_transp domain-containing protein n=1 Tax=Parastrongyloides trichosuri TaxID=131310 RepID=A0A0N4ZSN3_PARTI